MKKSLKKILRASLTIIAAVALPAATGSAPEWSGFQQFSYTVGCMLILAAAAAGEKALEK